MRAELDILEHEFVVLWAGRLDPVKRLDLLIHCAEIMSPVPSRFLLAGDGPARAAVELSLRHSSAAARVHLLGWREDLDRLMSAADAFLFPSRTEGMPNAVLQAMAFGLPVVASDIPPLRELSGDGERILLVGGDQPRPFADALLRLRDDPQLGRAMGERAATWAVGHLNPDAMVAAVLRVYRQVLRGRRVSRSGRPPSRP